ncbi:MAG: hypothetical protein VX899_12125 [Myxococcota bacterium]|nr:hypothetical protein [Myxococcota bacterium]
MYHIVARADAGLLISTWEDAAALWQRITRACAGMEALCLMPNHVHLQHHKDLRLELAQALRAHSRSLNHAQGLKGRRIEKLPESRWAADDQKRRRETRYIHLNPCRAGMVDDPLAWPWSTYRDAVGFAHSPVRPKHREPHRLHAYTSQDESVSLEGSQLPGGMSRDPTLHELQAAVSGYCRMPIHQLDQRGPARSLLLRSAKALICAKPGELADMLDTSPATLRRQGPPDEHVQRTALLLGDPRFPGIPAGRGFWTRY